MGIVSVDLPSGVMESLTLLCLVRISARFPWAADLPVAPGVGFHLSFPCHCLVAHGDGIGPSLTPGMGCSSWCGSFLGGVKEAGGTILAVVFRTSVHVETCSLLSVGWVLAQLSKAPQV